jgi:hypothetical protein
MHRDVLLHLFIINVRVVKILVVRGRRISLYIDIYSRISLYLHTFQPLCEKPVVCIIDK